MRDPKGGLPMNMNSSKPTFIRLLKDVSEVKFNNQLALPSRRILLAQPNEATAWHASTWVRIINQYVSSFGLAHGLLPFQSIRMR